MPACVCVYMCVCALPGWPFNDLQKTSFEAPDGSVLKTFTVGRQETHIFMQNHTYEEADVTADTDKPHPVHASGACTKL